MLAPPLPHPPGSVLYRSPGRWPGRVSRGGGAAVGGAGRQHDQAQALKLLDEGAGVQVQPLHNERLATAQRLQHAGKEEGAHVQTEVHSRCAAPVLDKPP